MLSWVEHEKGFITSGPEQGIAVQQKVIIILTYKEGLNTIVRAGLEIWRSNMSWGSFYLVQTHFCDLLTCFTDIASWKHTYIILTPLDPTFI